MEVKFPLDPPSYPQAAKLEASWDAQRPSRLSHQPYRANLLFEFQPPSRQSLSLTRLFRNRETQPSWCACLSISARNLPRLMRCGFTWSPENNIIPGSDWLEFRTRTAKLAYAKGVPFACWRHVRCYFLRDKLDGGEDGGEWVGVLWVWALRREVIATFDPGCITREMVVRVNAWNWKGQKVYCADKFSGLWFNLIFPRMPLSGWWPVPKGQHEQGEGLDDWGAETRNKRSYLRKLLDEIFPNSVLLPLAGKTPFRLG